MAVQNPGSLPENQVIMVWGSVAEVDVEQVRKALN